jgi:hypothetical protein
MYGRPIKYSNPIFIGICTIVVIMAISIISITNITRTAMNTSTLIIYIDVVTHCQYVGTSYGGLTQRMRDGKQICD